MGLHDDHRKRVRSLYLEKGADALDDVHLLELYLFYTNPRADVNPLAVQLLERFGTLDGVFSASAAELCSVSGVGENTAVLLTLLKPLFRRSALSSRSSDMVIQSADDAAEYLLPYFLGLPYETIYMVCMTSSGRVLRCTMLGYGSVSSADFSIEGSVASVLQARASCAILAHNHVNGEAEPSEEDLIATRIIAKEMKKSGILLLDHLIFSDNSFCSMNERGYFDFHFTEN